MTPLSCRSSYRMLIANATDTHSPTVRQPNGQTDTLAASVSMPKTFELIPKMVFPPYFPLSREILIINVVCLCLLIVSHRRENCVWHLKIADFLSHCSFAYLHLFSNNFPVQWRSTREETRNDGYNNSLASNANGCKMQRPATVIYGDFSTKMENEKQLEILFLIFADFSGTTMTRAEEGRGLRMSCTVGLVLASELKTNWHAPPDNVFVVHCLRIRKWRECVEQRTKRGI